MADLEHVDDKDEVIGIVSNEEANQRKLIHRITRIFLFDDAGRLYLQRRSLNMNSSPGLWDKSAAGHVDIGESYEQAAARELEEELGVKNLILNQIVKYYEEEPHPVYDHLKRFNVMFTAQYDGQEIVLDPNEVMGGKWIAITDLEDWIRRNPEEFSDGFMNAYKKYKSIE